MAIKIYLGISPYYYHQLQLHLLFFNQVIETETLLTICAQKSPVTAVEFIFVCFLKNVKSCKVRHSKIQNELLNYLTDNQLLKGITAFDPFLF